MNISTAGMEGREKTSFEKWFSYLGVPVAAIVFALLFTMKTPPGLTLQGKSAIAVFLAVFVLWVSQAVPTFVSSLIAIVLLTLTSAWNETSVLGVFGYDVIWLMVAAFIITSGMTKTGLANRVALWLVSTFGKTARLALISLIIVNFVIAFIVPSTTARAALMLPIALLVAQAYGAQPGKSNFGRLVMIQELQANNISTTAILTATAPQIMAVGLIRDLTRYNVSWSEWFIASFPVALCTMIVSYLVGLVIFKPEVSVPVVEDGGSDGIGKIREQLHKMGQMTTEEKKALFIFCITVFLWATDKWHVQMFGFKISLVMVAIISATLCYLPFIGLISWKDTKIPWDLMIFSAGAYAAGMALDKSGAAAWALKAVFGSLDLGKIGFFPLYMIVMFIAVFSHMVFTSKTVRTAILIPAVIGIANAAGINPIALALPVSFTIADSITLPPNCKPNLIFYSTGYFSVLDQFIYGVIVCIAKWLLLGIASLTWFKIIGIC
ncbi:MAG: DASS family sodium-coupled anion symporter [Thermoanaerobacteraceae bacterium]|nr:DASS family sodium-coupled anion symporter [Thermoanaerobacteraceae bacterium]